MKASVTDLVRQRNELRKKGLFDQADKIRRSLEKRGYMVRDSDSGTCLIPHPAAGSETRSTGKIALFGSGEMSTVGRRIHESIIKGIPPPISVALLETPAGFETNPHLWYRNMEGMLSGGLRNYHPAITCVPALRTDGQFSTNDHILLAPLSEADYIHTGAGSPTYAVRHLKNSLALSIMESHALSCQPLSFASAALCAMGRYQLPVYEIYRAGDDPYWNDGLDFFSLWGMSLTFIPHWNNLEGGKDIDTRYCYMGENRFNRLRDMLPADTVLIGIDEQTGVIVDFNKQEATVQGKGNMTVINNTDRETFPAGTVCPFGKLRLS